MPRVETNGQPETTVRMLAHEAESKAVCLPLPCQTHPPACRSKCCVYVLAWAQTKRGKWLEALPLFNLFDQIYNKILVGQ